jgi:hypothetical protein
VELMLVAVVVHQINRVLPMALAVLVVEALAL